MPAEKGNQYAVGNKGGGRKSLYKAEYANIAYNMCLLGSTDNELAQCFEVSEQTINNWKNEHEEFSLALKEGKTLADAKVARSLYERATGYEQETVKVFQFQGDPVVVPFTEHIAPDTGAAMAWLKNRQPSKWRDKQDIDMTIKDMPEIIIKKSGEE